MTREDFAALSLGTALKLLWDALPEGARAVLEEMPAPQPVRSPKYDVPIFRKDGVQWASETDLDGLRYFHKRSIESAAKGGQYAEKDAKNAAKLERWIAWREACPQLVWSGERNNVQLTAKPPVSKPTVYDKEPRASGSGSGGAQNDPIPFARWEPPCP